MRLVVFLASASLAGLLATSAVADAPLRPEGNFGGGALVAPPTKLLDAGNAVVAIRARSTRALDIEATVRARCSGRRNTGGDIIADARVGADGRFSTTGTTTQEPVGARVRTTYRISGAFRSRSAADGTLSATVERTQDGTTTRCRTGTVAFAVRRPDGRLGAAGAAPRARYHGTTTQRSVGPLRPITLRVSADGRRITRALFSHALRCSDDTRSIGVEGPRENIPIGRSGTVEDRDRFTFDDGGRRVYVDDRFTAQLGSRGARGTLSLSDRTIDIASGNTIQTCETGTIRWKASR